MKLFEKYEAERDADKKIVAPGVRINQSLYTAWTGHSPSVGLGDVGLELEVEGRDLVGGMSLGRLQAPDTKAHWNLIADGSLRGESGEYVLSTPCKTSELRHMVGGLFDLFKEHGSRIRNSNRCSTHVHVNVQDLRINQITSVIALWSTFAAAFTRWCGEDRVSNHFCLSTSEEESLVDSWELFLDKGAWPREGGLKYTSLNILPLQSLGSLEFRCGGAPDEADKIVYWAKICNAIVRYAAETYPNPMQLSYALSEVGPKKILREILEYANLGPRTTETIYEDICQQTDVQMQAFEGFRLVQSIVAEPNWDASMEEINKEFVPSPFSTTTTTTRAVNMRRIRVGDDEWIVQP